MGIYGGAGVETGAELGHQHFQVKETGYTQSTTVVPLANGLVVLDCEVDLVVDDLR